MNYLKEHYRELLNSINFFRDEKAVYQQIAPDAAKGLEIKKPTEAAATPAATEKTHDDFKKIEDKINQHLEPLKKLDPKTAEQHSNEAKTALAESIKNYEIVIKENRDTKENVLKGIHKKFDELIKSQVAKLPSDIKTKYEAAVAAAKKTAEAKPGAPEKAPEKKVKLTDAQLDKALGQVAKNITDKYVQGELKNALAKVQFTPDQIKQLEKGNLALTPDQLKQVREAMFGKGTGRENLKPASQEEFKLVKEFTNWSKLDDFFDDSDDPAFVYLSQKHEITKADEGKKGIKVDGKPVEEIKDLRQYMPEKMQGNFDKALEGKLGDKEEKELLDDLKGRVKTNEAMMQLQNELLSKENLAKIEKAPGAIEGLALLLQLFKAIKTAFETGDWATLGDFIQDWQTSKNPQEMQKRMQESKDAYAERFNRAPKPTLKQLVMGHVDPRGKEADALFLTGAPEGKKVALGKYRTEAKGPIESHLTKELGLKKITKTEKIGENFVEITAEKANNEQIAIELDLREEKPKAKIIPYQKQVEKNEKTGETSEKIVKTETKEDFKEVTLAQLGEMLGKAPEATPPATPPKPGEASPTKTEKGQEAPDDKNKERLDAVKTLKDADINALRAQIQKDPALRKAYQEFVANFQKTNKIQEGEWTPEQTKQCRMDFLTGKINGNDKTSLAFIDKVIKRGQKPEIKVSAR